MSRKPVDTTRYDAGNLAHASRERCALCEADLWAAIKAAKGAGKW